MKVAMSLLFILLIFITSGIHLYFVWKKKDYRTLYVQFGILAMAIVLGVWAIWGNSVMSISNLMDAISPF
ncbi:hypothetical protein PU629_09935 [Pullulanibacillus sp. KACC 23026]|uniref:hypothetical protein n=1 Tax=Pullulanibacillus sp. KACC 23026 TaxID=3028315 RepID=UPI0023B0A34A|nr:hypothetical protein [Pullulanibacillus sp. KACC 23026]WEG14653.1 hypothetical protein PU629_09935 [Pullulanibacillus sp. KACC 23026]